MPAPLEPQTIYISVEYATCQHLCMCGCGEKVITPLTPTDWRFTFDGETISLDPSIGNWSFDCQSHYWIEQSRVFWARKWSKEKIETNRARGLRMKERKYGGNLDDEVPDLAARIETERKDRGAVRRILERLALQRRR